MKIFTKILNWLAVIIFIVGIACIIYVINDISYKDDFTRNKLIIDSLDRNIQLKTEHIIDLNVKLSIVEGDKLMYKELWQKANVNLKKAKEENTQLKEVKNLPTDKLIEYILDYFNSDATDATLVQEGDSIYVVLKPYLMDSIGQTIAKYEDNLDLLEAYDVQITTSNDLINSLTKENELLVAKTIKLDEINNDLLNQNNMYKTTRKLHEKQIKRLKYQRTIIGVAGVVLVVLILI